MISCQQSGKRVDSDPHAGDSRATSGLKLLGIMTADGKPPDLSMGLDVVQDEVDFLQPAIGSRCLRYPISELVQVKGCLEPIIYATSVQG